MTVMHQQSNTELSCNSKATPTTDHACRHLHSNDIEGDQFSNTHVQEITHNNVKFIVFLYFKLHFYINM